MNEKWNKYVGHLKTMNFSKMHIQAHTEIIEKWDRTGLLKGVDDPHIVQCLAVILDNQRLFNELSIANEKSENTELLHYSQQGLRCSIPILRRVFGPDFIGYDLISIQPATSPAGNMYYIDENGNTKHSEYSCNTRFRQTIWDAPVLIRDENGTLFEFNGQRYSIGLDAESYAVFSFTNKLKNEIAREIITDLTDHAGKSHVCEYESVDQVLNMIDGISSYIALKNQNKEANWVVLSPYMVKLLSDHIELVEDSEPQNNDYVKKIGVLNGKWEVIEDSSYSNEKILVGLKGKTNHYLSGYFFSPYIFWNLNPNYRLNEKEPGWIMSRYAKKLINSGFYGLIRFENLPDLEQKEEAKQEEVENGV